MARMRNARGQYVSTGGGSGGHGYWSSGGGGGSLGFSPSGVQLESIGRLTDGTHALGGALASVSETAGHVALHMAEIGVAGGLALAIHGVVGLNNELEQTKIGLAAIFQSQGYYKSFEDGMARSAEEVQKMRKDVMLLPTTFQELAHTMQMIATPAAHAGANIDEIRRLAEKTTLAAGIFMMPQELAAREMAQLLTGHMNARNRLGLEMGFEAKEFNQKGHADQLKEIEERLAKFDDSAAAFANSFKAQSTSFKDNLLMFEQIATKGAFEHVKQSLVDVNAWFDAHREQVSAVAEIVDKKLVGAWEMVVQDVKQFGPEVKKAWDEIDRITPSLAEMNEALKATVGFFKDMASYADWLVRDFSTVALLKDAMKSGEEGENAAQLLKARYEDLVAGPGHHEAEDALKKRLRGVADIFGDPQYGAAFTYQRDHERWRKEMAANHGEATRPEPEASREVSDYLQKSHPEYWFEELHIALGNREKEEKPAMGGVPASGIMKVEIVVKGSDDPSRVARFTVDELMKRSRNPRQSPTVPNYSQARMR